MEVAESMDSKIIEVSENESAEWGAKSPFKDGEVNESDNTLNAKSLTSADNANENSECQCESNETDKEKNDSCENDKAELTDDEVDFIDETEDETDNPFEMGDNFFNMDDNPFNRGSNPFSIRGSSSPFDLFSPMAETPFSELDKYAVSLSECFDSNIVKAVDLPVDEFKNAVRIAVAIVTGSVGIKDALSKQLSNTDKEISTLVHACEFSDTTDIGLKIEFFDELHKLRVKRREIKCKTDIINAVCTNLNNVCKRFKPSVLSAIDKEYEKYEPNTNNELIKELLSDNSNMLSEEIAIDE